MKFILEIMPIYLTYKLLRYAKDYDDRKSRERIDEIRSKDKLKERIFKER
ncbi:MAG: hypothetical protein PT942_07010 [Eubacteriales bacterium]|nr:hypothetical protein [Eubacteriales bacterium]